MNTLITTTLLAILAGTAAGLAAAWLVVKLNKPARHLEALHASPVKPFFIANKARQISPAEWQRLLAESGAPSYIDGGLVGGNKGDAA